MMRLGREQGLPVYPVLYGIWKGMLLGHPVAAPSSGPLPEK